MNPWPTVLLIAAAAAAVVIAIAYICFRMAFYVPESSKPDGEAILLPDGKIYEPYHRAMTDWILETRAMPHEEMTITSFDGLTLHGRFLEFAPGAPIELIVHGYPGTG